MPELMHAKHVGLTHAEDEADLVLTVPVEQVSGGAGFVNASGEVSLDLATGRAFHHTMTGNITGVTLTNAPDADAYLASWVWVLKIDGTGGYSFASPFNVTWVDGGSWSDLDLTADAVNVMAFWRAGATVYGALVWNGETPLDPYKVCFLEDAAVVILTEAEDIDVANATKNGDGTITYARDSGSGFGSITTRTTFGAGDRLRVTCDSLTGTTTVRIPRFAP